MRNDIKNILKETNMTQRDLAEKAGLEESYINAIMNEKRDPGIKAALKICRALDRPFEDIFSLY